MLNSEKKNIWNMQEPLNKLKVQNVKQTQKQKNFVTNCNVCM